MKLLAAFFRLIRWPNLFFIAVTQLLYYYAIVEPLTKQGIGLNLNRTYFVWLIIASLLIAAAGYIINDYFDLNIDQVNKPSRLNIDKIIKRRWAMLMHLAMSFTAVLIGFYIDYGAGLYWVGLSNLGCVLLLFGYSVALKKKFLIGNVLISAMTAWVIVVVFFCFYNKYFFCLGCDKAMINTQINRFIRITFLYVSFAFIISLIREVIKDMEDMEGDAKYGCKTMPIVWGIPATKVFTAVWIIVLVGILATVQVYVLQFGWWWSTLYCVLLIIAPLLWILYQLYHAKVATDYKRLSAAVKLVMFTGIMSMWFFKLYA
ncbi:MAG TPA: geranylgeranylglycerol-phosphate geranylgeranyltransferase [Ferruginibacter sp.]|nr:geranylgeranylglycerol-phosphate geranylgeranyltransferase [Ferruginibacter sp.]